MNEYNILFENFFCFSKDNINSGLDLNNIIRIILNSKEFKQFANVVSYDDALGSAWFANELIKLNQERM